MSTLLALVPSIAMLVVAGLMVADMPRLIRERKRIEEETRRIKENTP